MNDRHPASACPASATWGDRGGCLRTAASRLRSKSRWGSQYLLALMGHIPQQQVLDNVQVDRTYAQF